MEILYITLKYISWFAFILGLPILLAQLSSRYLFKAKDWRSEVVAIFTLFWTFYVFNWNEVSFLGYIDWFLVKMVEFGLPFLLASYLHKRFLLDWNYYLILLPLLIINSVLVRGLLVYFEINLPQL